MQTRAIRSPVAGCAREVLEVVPMVMRVIRGELRKYGAREMSVPQYRTLGFVYRNDGASLSELADHVGLTLSTMSTLVDGLVARGLVNRREDPEDRRRMTLTLTELGRNRHEVAREATLISLGEMLSQLSPSDRATVTRAMQVLRERFSGGKAYAEN
jgi:DNA-binding MarR family transcriptional regulator